MCVLRVQGENLAVRDFFERTTLTPVYVYQKGELDSRGKLFETSGFNVSISSAEFNDLERQVEDTIDFLQREDRELKRLLKYPNVESVVIDFAINTPPDEIVVWSRAFPVSLLSLLSASNIGLEFTIYPQVNEEE